MDVSAESVAARLDRASRIARRNLGPPPSRTHRKERKHRALFQQVEELLAKHNRNGSSDASTAVTENASFYSQGSGECHPPLHVEQYKPLRRPPEEDLVSRHSSEASVPIDVDTMQEYHADDETLMTTETTMTRQQQVEIQFDRMSLRPRPNQRGGLSARGDASLHTTVSWPVSCDESGPIDVDTGESVDEEDDNDDYMVHNVILDESEFTQGLAGYVEGFEPPVIRYTDVFEPMMEEEENDKINADTLYEV